MVEVFDGKIELDIKPATKNNDVVIVKNVKLPNGGNYNVILNVVYPDNISDLINFLEKDK